jgi:asparagine synthase (glutamine-hydrolysing)
MCGICGHISKEKITAQDIELVSNMNDKLSHRGPNSAGYFNDDKVSIAMRRLSIIDLDGGQQPLWNEDKTIVLIANGEIYNYIELKETLEKLGHQYKTSSDCESIIHAYEEYPNNFIEKLRGMFAFCLYDIKKSKIIIARDRLGEKPLYYHIDSSKSISFSSEMKSIISSLKKEDLKLNFSAIYQYFHYQYIPEPQTILENVMKLSAGHLLEIDTRSFEYRISKYWDMENSPEIKSEPEITIKEELESIHQIITRSDVPIGISLSGGIDSSIIALMTAKNIKGKIHAFSVGYPNSPINDERKNALNLAKKLGFLFHSIEINTIDFVKDFKQMVYDMDDPIADIAGYGYYRVAKEARKNNVPVILAGFGGDELFWGYDWTRKAVERNILKRTLIGKCRLFILLLLERRSGLFKNPAFIIKSTLKESFTNSVLLYEWTSSWRRTRLNQKNIFTKSFLKNIDKDITNKYESSIGTYTKNIGNRITSILSKVWLISNCIALGDRLNMSQGVELRLPLIDFKLYEKVFGLRKNNPYDYVKGYKHDLIQSTKDFLPEEIINRKKMGFNPPTHEWMKNVVLENKKYLLDGILVNKDILKKEYLLQNFDAESPRFEFLYTALVLEMWLQQYYKFDYKNKI